MTHPEHRYGSTLNTEFAAQLPANAAPILDAAALAELAPFGEERAVEVGDVLFRAGDATYEFVVVLDGAVDIIRPDIECETLITTHYAGRFLGELNMVTGQHLYLTARVSERGRVLAIPAAEFRRVMSTKPDLADTIFSAFVARRDILRAGEGRRAVRIIGSRYSREAMALRAFAARSRLPHEWIDTEGESDVEVLLAGMGFRPRDTPVVITSSGVLRRPTPGEFAQHLGLTFQRPPDYMFDLDAVSTGGQAGSSSRIENYVGFPNGISGEELASRAAIQAQRLGARLNSPCEVAGLRVENGFQIIMLADGSQIACRSVIIASGARYQRLAVDDLERFEGAGVYYAATDLEARICSGHPVVVVGGGNSAGQAAIYLAQQGSRVSIVIRSSDLTHSMSHYLIERIEADARIELITNTDVCGLEGENHLSRVTLEHRATGERFTTGCAGLFCFIGADPATAWLDEVLELDAKRFILTDRSLPAEITSGPLFATRDPLPFETSVPGVFAVGDVRSGSMKRVAAAVGEGSSAVRSVHDHLATIAH